MESYNTRGRLRNISYYIPKALKFYDLKNEHLTRTVFVSTVFILFIIVYDYIAFVLDENTAGAAVGGDLLSSVVISVVMYLLAGIYLTAAIKDLKGKEYTFSDCSRIVSIKVFKIILASLVYAAIVNIGFIILIVPGIALFIIYLFNLSYIIDLGYGISDSFAASKRLTKGYRWQIFSIMLVFFLVVFLPLSLIVSFSFMSRNILIITFVLSFSSAAVALMQQKLIAMLYLDLEYGQEETNHPK